MPRHPSALAVILLMIIAVLFGCQCGGVPQNAPPGGFNNNNNEVVDPAEQAAADLVKRFGHYKLEGGHVVEVGIYDKGFTEADVKPLATLTRLRQLKISGVD